MRTDYNHTCLLCRFTSVLASIQLSRDGMQGNIILAHKSPARAPRSRLTLWSALPEQTRGEAVQQSEHTSKQISDVTTEGHNSIILIFHTLMQMRNSPAMNWKLVFQRCTPGMYTKATGTPAPSFLIVCRHSAGNLTTLERSDPKSLLCGELKEYQRR